VAEWRTNQNYVQRITWNDESKMCSFAPSICRALIEFQTFTAGTIVATICGCISPSMLLSAIELRVAISHNISTAAVLVARKSQEFFAIATFLLKMRRRKNHNHELGAIC
jgi:hypothetical protein